MKQLNAEMLDSRMTQALIPGLQEVMADLKQFVVEARDFELVDINPRKIARQRRLDDLPTLKAFLHLTKAGVFDLSWSIHCPHCKGATVHADKLGQLQAGAHCSMCNADYQAGFDQNVELSFKINPSVAQLSDLDPILVANQGFELEPGITIDLEPGESHFIQMYLKAGNYGITRLDGSQIVNLPIAKKPATTASPGAAASTKTLEIVFDPDLPMLRIMPLVEGDQGLRVTNRGPGAAGFLLARVVPPQWTDAALVSTLQEFRDLFSKEMLSPDQAFSIQNLSLIFTDIKSSTEMYERLGDAKAFSLVKEHFSIMEAVVRQENGGVVKTIGDAVMAVFNTPQQAIRAARRMIEAFDEFNAQEHITDEIIVKIGIHQGPCIAVTLNERLDYFGTSLNIAARIQGLSDGRDIMVSERLYQEAGGAKLFGDAGWQAERFVTSLKGLKDTYPVWKLHRN